MADAACRDVDTEVFFTDSVTEQRMVIRTFCDQCPVIVECRTTNDAREHGIGAMFIFGVVGGETAQMRRKRRRAARRAARRELATAG